MKRLPTTILVVLISLLALSAATAWGQYGLYGSPDMVNLPAPGQIFVAQAPGPVQPGAAGGPIAGIPSPPPPPLAPSLAPSPVGQPFGPENPAAPNVMSQLLSDGAPGAPAAAPAAAGCDSCGVAASCGDAPNCFPVGDCPWFVSLQALGLTRDKAHRLWTTYETGNEANQLMNSDDISEEWRWGGEVRFGRRFCCGTMALEGVYWSVNNFDGMASMTNPNGVSTTLTTGWVEMLTTPAFTADLWFDNAAGHRLWLEDELHNAELNLIRSPLAGAVDCGWEADFTVGVRYFRFAEGLIFGSVANGFWWGQDPAEEIYIVDRVKNELVGFQFGFTGAYNFSPTWRFFATPKFGIYNNHIEHYFNVALGDGTGAVPAAGSGQSGSYPVRSKDDAVSFLTQIDLGIGWRFSRNWSAQAGYRVVAVTGMALANEQIPQQIVDIPEIAAIDHSESLILHGAFVGITCDF